MGLDNDLNDNEMNDEDNALDPPILVNTIIGNEVHTEYIQPQSLVTAATASIASSINGTSVSTMSNTPTAASLLTTAARGS